MRGVARRLDADPREISALVPASIQNRFDPFPNTLLEVGEDVHQMIRSCGALQKRDGSARWKRRRG